ncbi:MAG: UDP-N-acetylmuramoyl-L-alanyl-D-glutamate--2,6-diaminopimelate ligase [Myxococcaceae bacterium]
MKLSDVLSGCGAEQVSGSRAKVEITAITADSRQVEPGHLFVAVPGTKTDGSQFVGEAIARGAAAIVAEKPVEAKVPVYTVGSAKKALAIIAANFYGNPARELTLLAVTGTNGKTTTSYLLESMAAAGGGNTGIIGTIQYKYSGRTFDATHTTPDAIALHKLFRDMVDAGTDTVVMEVSSHALQQERVHGLTFRAAGFTNLSRDHLDYHKDMEEYFQAKRKLFAENLSPGGVAVVSAHDTYAMRIYNELRGQKRMAWKFSRAGEGEISAANVEYTLAGIKATLKTPAGDIPVKSKLIGMHNLDNILTAVGMALGAGYSRRDVQDGIERVTRVPGRMEAIEGQGITALVDYAHTDDALVKALETVKALSKGRAIVVFGCGGDRDKGKRPLMGTAAAEGADLVIVTSDNPRTEEPDAIIGEITPGIEKAGVRRMSPAKAKTGERGYLVESDRAAAIQLAANLAKPGDVILIAGKGHEAYQIVGTNKTAFDDREVAAKALANRKE